MSINSDDTLPLTTFTSGRKPFRLEFVNREIRWDNARPPYAQQSIPTRNVISVTNDAVSHKTNKETNSTDSFTIHYIEQKKKNKWKSKQLTLEHSEAYQITLWTETLQHHLLIQYPLRPKNILLFINPYGGRKMGQKIYEKRAKRLFELAGIDVTMFVTERQNHIRDKLNEDNLDNFDSICCVGGDGTVAEIINGLVLRECKIRGVDMNEVDVELPTPTLRIGIIPGGSTDTTVYCLHGTIDSTTAVLQIILGDTLGLDLVAVHDKTGFLKVYADVASYGFLGDIAYYSEKLRWMGPTRYEFTGLKKIMANEAYTGEISILTDNSNTSAIGTKCYENCQQCSLGCGQQKQKANDPVWKTINGKFFMVSGANISCAGDRNPNGLAPYCHLGDGFLHLLLIYHSSFINSILTLKRFTKPEFSTDDLQNVEVYRTKEFHFRAGNNRSWWNCDGEVIEPTDIHARVHRQLVTVYGRGFAPSLKNKS